MAVRAYVVPSVEAQSVATLATDLGGEANITSAAVDPGSTKVSRVAVEAVAAGDVTAAITAVGNCQLQPGTVIETI